MHEHWLHHPQTLQALQKLVRRDFWEWGCLYQITDPKDVIARLNHFPAAFLRDLSTPYIHVYHTRELGLGHTYRIHTKCLAWAVQTHQLPADTCVALKYQHGNLFCTIDPEVLSPTLKYSQDVYLYVDAKERCLFSHHIGSYHWHHALYEYQHLDGKTTTVEKLLKADRFTSVYLDTSDPDGLSDIPY